MIASSKFGSDLQQLDKGNVQDDHYTILSAF